MQAELKSFVYIDRSLRAKKDKLIGELNFKKCMQLKISLKSKFFVGITKKQRKYIIHPDLMVANQEIMDQFIQNLKSNPNKVHDLTGKGICASTVDQNASLFLNVLPTYVVIP